MTSLVDRYLLYRIRALRDPEAFARLYDKYVSQIYRFVLLKLPSKEDAEDLTSETFLKSWRYLQENREVTEFRGLLYRIARNAIVDWYRARATSPSGVSLTVTIEEGSTSSIEQDVSDTGKGRTLMEARADLSLVMDKLGRLKDDYRDILTLRLVDGLSFPVIAEIMEKTPGAVRVLYHRAKKALEALDS